MSLNAIARPAARAPWARVVPVLAVIDVRAAVAWYFDVLGLVERVRIGEAHRAQLGVEAERAGIIVREYRQGDARVPGAHQLMFRVDDVQAVLDAARTAGADADEEPERLGVRRTPSRVR